MSRMATAHSQLFESARTDCQSAEIQKRRRSIRAIAGQSTDTLRAQRRKNQGCHDCYQYYSRSPSQDPSIHFSARPTIEPISPGSCRADDRVIGGEMAVSILSLAHALSSSTAIAPLDRLGLGRDYCVWPGEYFVFNEQRIPRATGAHSVTDLDWWFRLACVEIQNS